MIPKLIHQTAKTRHLPPRVQRYVDRVKQLHPTWTYTLWTDADNLSFVRTEFPDLLGMYNALPVDIMRADFIRYLLMSRLGGLYVDTDYEFLRPFELLDYQIVLPWETNHRRLPGLERIANSIFASEPGHRFWDLVIGAVAADPPLSPDANVLDSTGPGLVTRVYHKATADGLRMYTPPGEMFCPQVPRNHRQYRAIVDSGVSHGIHHCFGSWRKVTTLGRLRRAVAVVTNPLR